MDPETTSAGADRLDSWKAIAQYLGRDAATVRRWEKGGAGLPIRRVAGSRGHSVFAYRSEIDEWLRNRPSNALVTSPVTDPFPASEPAAAPTVSGSRLATWRWWMATAATLTLISVAWGLRASWSEEVPVAVRVLPEAVVATDREGIERWRYAFPPGRLASPLVEPAGALAERLTGESAGVPARIANWFHPDESVDNGQLLLFSPTGALRRTFEFTDRVTFGSGAYDGPWTMIDSRVTTVGRPDLVAVVARHYQWWPSLVTVLDERWARRGMFVNAGWVERVHWLSRDRLLIAGFSNARDGGMVAMLDANALDGQSPAPDDSPYRCRSCGAGAPLRYIVFPRSEVNRVTASPFNRVVLQITGGRFVARTVEVPPDISGPAVDALYEFSSSLDLIRASYSDRYWEIHRALEQQGIIRHTREQCPGREGPPAIDVWDPQHGWKSLQVPRGGA